LDLLFHNTDSPAILLWLLPTGTFLIDLLHALYTSGAPHRTGQHLILAQVAQTHITSLRLDAHPTKGVSEGVQILCGAGLGRRCGISSQRLAVLLEPHLS